jgi:hypothetical protein
MTAGQFLVRSNTVAGSLGQARDRPLRRILSSRQFAHADNLKRILRYRRTLPRPRFRRDLPGVPLSFCWGNALRAVDHAFISRVARGGRDPQFAQHAMAGVEPVQPGTTRQSAYQLLMRVDAVDIDDEVAGVDCESYYVVED